MKYVYPALFRTESIGGYSVRFPDIRQGGTSGSSMLEAIEYAEDFLCAALYDMERYGEPIPTVTDPSNIKLNEGEFVTLVVVETDDYRKWHAEQAAKKEARKAARAAKKKPELAPVG